MVGILQDQERNIYYQDISIYSQGSEPDSTEIQTFRAFERGEEKWCKEYIPRKGNDHISEEGRRLLIHRYCSVVVFSLVVSSSAGGLVSLASDRDGGRTQRCIPPQPFHSKCRTFRDDACSLLVPVSVVVFLVSVYCDHRSCWGPCDILH